MPDGYARTSETLAPLWSCTFNIVGNCGDVAGIAAPTVLGERQGFGSCYVNGFGGSAALAYYQAGASWYVLPGPEVGTNGGTWRGLYYVWKLTVAVGATTASKYYAFWVRDENLGIPLDYVSGLSPVYVYDDDHTISVTCSLSNSVHCRKRVDESGVPELQDPTQLGLECADYALAGAQVTVSADGISASGAYADAGSNTDASDYTTIYSVTHLGFRAANATRFRLQDMTVLGNECQLEDLYNPGTGDEPDHTNYPNYKRAAPESGAYLHFFNDGGSSLQRSSTSNPLSATVGFILGAPTTLVYHDDLIRYFDPDGEQPTGLMITAEPRTWDDEAEEWVQDEWAVGSGPYSKTQWRRSWLTTEEWDVLSDAHKGGAWFTQASRESEGEDVGAAGGPGSEHTEENDDRLLFAVQGLSDGVDNVQPHWGPFISLARDNRIEVNDPDRTTSRPSAWAGSGGVTVNPADNDSWSVAAGSVTPKVARTLVSRRPLRDASPDDDHPEWAWLNKPNPPEGFAAVGDPEEWDALVPEEDAWHWAQMRYLLVEVTAPVAGTIGLAIEWEADGSTYSGTYSFDAAAGANTVQLDLALNSEGLLPIESARMERVVTLEFALPANATGSAQVWTLDDLGIIQDGVNEPTTSWHTHRPWDWPANDRVWFSAQADGLPALCVNYGTAGNLRAREWGLQGVVGGVARTLPELVGDINRQDGWTASYEDPDEAEDNQDADDVQCAPTLYAWDLQHQERDATDGCVLAGRYDWCPGHTYHLFLTCYPRGKVAGLALSEGAANVARSVTGAVWLYASDAEDGTYTRVESLDADTQGRFESSPLIEKSCFYGVSGRDLGASVAAGALAVSGLEVANRQYTFATVELLGSLWDPHLDRDPFGGIWRVAERDGCVFAHCSDNRDTLVWAAQGKPFGADATSYARPTVACCSDGSILCAATNTDTGSMEFARLRERNGEWEVVSTATLGNGLTMGGICARDGAVYCVGWAGDEIIHTASDTPDLVASDLTPTASELVVCDAVVTSGGETPRSSCVALTDGSVVVCVDTGGTMTHYRCRSYDEAETDGHFTNLG